MDFSPIIITGHYGSGKTEFCVNLALDYRKKNPDGLRIFLADMDVINPYFRSREKADFLLNYNIEIIGNNLNNTTNQDLPAISGQVIRTVLANQNLIVDLAGSLHGLKTLTFFKQFLKKYQLLVVLNAFREESDSVQKMLDFINNVEVVSGLSVTGIVHNSHMIHETKPFHILNGQEIISEVSRMSSIPIKMTFIRSDIYEQVKEEIVSPAMTFDRLIMREDWQ